MTLLNGHEAQVREVADHTLTVLMARAMTIIGIPVIGFLLVFIFHQSVENGTSIALANAAIEAKTKDRYTSGDASKDFALRDAILKEHERRIGDLEHPK